MNEPKILLIGLGYHARRIYYPFFSDIQKNLSNLVCALDLVTQKDTIDNYLKMKGHVDFPVYYTNNTMISDDLSIQELEQLDNIISIHGINAVIIATEPLSHFKYAKWALNKGLHILMDKPITTEENVTNDIRKAKKLYSDYLLLKDLYLQKIQEKKIVFNLLAQRRYHPAFTLMKQLVSEVQARTGCMISSIQSIHSDGQWRTPTEIVDIPYHSYSQGYGKLSHSGYHSIDIASWLIGESETDEKQIDNVEIYSLPIMPTDVLNQLNLTDYNRIFPNYASYNNYDWNSYNNLFQNYGEIDLYNTIAFKQGTNILSVATSSLIHNGFSQRGWPSAEKKDLYKGNGRVRQESHYIAQGPFQSISFISYQSQEILKDVQDPYDVGGEHHLDIHVFRNNTLFPDWKAHQVYKIQNLLPTGDLGYSRGHQEDSRREGIKDFIDSIMSGNNSSPSNFLSHQRGTLLMSGLYQSINRKNDNSNPVINLEYPKEIKI